MAPTPDSQVTEYLHRVFGPDRTGVVACAVGTGPHYDQRGKYRHQTFSPRYFAWPHDLNKLTRWAVTSSQTGDVYVCPALRTGRERRNENASAPAGWAWADIDGPWTQRRTDRFATLATGGAFAVSSGSGTHVYVPLADDADQEQLERANRALVRMFDADAKWAANSLLRLPGTLNWKSCARDRSAAVPVRFYRPTVLVESGEPTTLDAALSEAAP